MEVIAPQEENFGFFFLERASGVWRVKINITVFEVLHNEEIL